MSETNDPQCATCRFSKHAAFGSSSLECHISPPVVVVLSSEAVTCWPQVSPDNWCGEYEAPPKPRSARYGGGAIAHEE